MVSDKIIKTMSSSSRSLSAETIANNDDLLSQILLCLPLKSLLKFKCVSKHWLYLVSSPHFNRRLNISNLPCALLMHSNKWPRSNIPEFDFIKLQSIHFDVPFKTLNFDDNPSGIYIIHSCNGLLLCTNNYTYSSEAKYYVYNPTTEQYTNIPPPPSDGIIYPYLAFDPSKSPHYKVVCVSAWENVSDPECWIDIYSSKTGSWRTSAACFELDMDIGFHGGIFCNGAIHWYTDSGPSFCFDVDQEQVREMAIPPKPEDWYQRRVKYFGESRGHLYFVDIYNPPSTQFNVCEMEQDYSGWYVKYRVDLAGVSAAFPEMIRSNLDPSELNYYIFQIMYIVREESEDDSYMFLHLPGKIIRYNFKDTSFNKLCDANTSPEFFTYYDAYEYIKSVACVW